MFVTDENANLEFLLRILTLIFHCFFYLGICDLL